MNFRLQFTSSLLPRSFLHTFFDVHINHISTEVTFAFSGDIMYRNSSIHQLRYFWRGPRTLIAAIPLWIHLVFGGKQKYTEFDVFVVQFPKPILSA